MLAVRQRGVFCNAALKPKCCMLDMWCSYWPSSQVIDSRTFGFIPMSNIIGRVIYSGTSPSDSAPVVNNPFSADLDQAIIDAEVDPEQLFASDSK